MSHIQKPFVGKNHDKDPSPIDDKNPSPHR